MSATLKDSSLTIDQSQSAVTSDKLSSFLFYAAKTAGRRSLCGCSLTYELLVPDIQRHVPQSGGHRTHHPVIIHPQQLHQDGQPLLFPHRRPDVGGKLGTNTHREALKAPQRSRRKQL